MYRYANKDNTMITDGELNIPIAPGNRHYTMVMEWVAEGNTIAAYEPPPTTNSDVNVERDRRMENFTFAGKEFDISKENGSLANVSGAGTLALAAIVNGAQPNDLRWADANNDFYWIANDNSLVPMDAQTTFAFASAAATWRKQMIYAARAIKDMVSIPSDFKANNTYWG